MTFDQIEYFLTVVKYNSFTKAAEQICISQSSLSKQIKALEYELNVKLLNRNTAQHQLTEAGMQFLIFAERISMDYHDLCDNMKQYNTLDCSYIKMATIPVLGVSQIVSRLSEFQLMYERIRLDLLEREQIYAIQMLDNNSVDMAIVRIDNIILKKYDVIPLFTDEIVCICHKKHPISKRKVIDIQELKDEKFILYDRSSALHSIIINQCEQHGFTPNIIYSLSRQDLIMSMVEKGNGITLLTRNSLVLKKYPQLTSIDLRTPITSTCAVIKLKNCRESKEVQHFWHFLMQ